MPRSKAIMIAATTSILLVFASAVLALNVGMFNAGADNVGKLTPVAATAPAAPTTVTVYLDPTTAVAPPAAADSAPVPSDTPAGEPTDKRDHEAEEGHDD